MESVFIKDGIDYGNLHTRKDFYDYVQEDIRENVWDMTDGELDITVEYCRLLDFFQGLTVTLPKRKKKLSVIVLGASRNFVKCLRYLLIPDNSAAYLTLRMLSENLIILKFLLQNDASYTVKWAEWLQNSVSVGDDGGFDGFKREKERFLKKLRKEYDGVDGNKIEFDQLIRNQYGWAFPALKRFINLQSISEYCNETDAYDRFRQLSADVHGNTVVQNNQSRMDFVSYRIVSVAAQLMDGYLDVLLDYVGARQTAARRFISIYDDVTAKTRDFFSNVVSAMSLWK